MKKAFVLMLLATLLVCGLFVGCSSPADIAESIDLADTPVKESFTVELKNGGRSAIIVFDVPKDGFFKLIAFDSTEYDIYPDEICRIFAELPSGRIEITDGMTESVAVKAGRLKVIFTFKDKSKMMKSLSVGWAYAADSKVMLIPDKQAVAVAKNGKAEFSLSLEKPSLIKIRPAEACVFDTDCGFYITDSKGQKATNDIFIHATEWSYSRLFLDAGEYTVTVNRLSGIGVCSVEVYESFDSISTSQSEGLTVPATLGFNSLIDGQRSLSFSADGKDKYLRFEAEGSGTFYDSEQEVALAIFGPDGNEVNLSSDEYDADNGSFAGAMRLDISKWQGNYSIMLTTNDSCVVRVYTSNE